MKNISKTINTKTSGTTSHSQSRINPLLLFNISMYTLAAICFMVYTTELNYAHADDEDLGSASSSLDASVTVGTACNFSGNVDIPHTSTIMNGVNSTDIGKTTINVTCNDQGGYAVYAIGYTNDEYGNTALQSSISDDYNISTGTATSGNTSNWSMKLATVSGTTTATIGNGYSNYSVVPDDYTKVATLNTITNPGTSTAGSSISTTYQAYISPTQPAGTYSGKVKYTLVHPSTAPAPEKPVTINDLTYMQDFATLSADDKASVLDSMGTDTQYTLKDIRDKKDYYISKLMDGKVWMTQNLGLMLDSGRIYTPANTDVSANWQPTRSTIEFAGTTVDSWTLDSYTPYSASPGELYIYTSNTTDDDNQYTSLTACQAAHSDCSAHNHVGNYYNWSAAVASNDTNTTNLTTQYNNAPDSICPAGWRLPVAIDSANTTASREWNTLLVAEDVIIDPTNSLAVYTTNGFNNIRTSPLWLTRSGGVYNKLFSGAGNRGNYWSSTIFDRNNVWQLAFYQGNFYPIQNFNRGVGFPIRCLVK